MEEGVAYEQEASEPHQPHRPGQAVPVPGRSVQGEIVVLFKQLNIDIERVQPIIVSPNSDFLKGFESIH